MINVLKPVKGEKLEIDFIHSLSSESLEDIMIAILKAKTKEGLKINLCPKFIEYSISYSPHRLNSIPVNYRMSAGSTVED